MRLLFPLFFLLLTQPACRTVNPLDIPPPKTLKSFTQTFGADFEDVWRAVQITVSHYPLKINDMDSGVLETGFIKSNLAWTPPYNDKVRGGTRYSLSFKVIRDPFKKKKNTVVVKKHVEHKADFFTEHKSQPSDGLEEKAILYRISRELKIQKMLNKVSQN